MDLEVCEGVWVPDQITAPFLLPEMVDRLAGMSCSPHPTLTPSHLHCPTLHASPICHLPLQITAPFLLPEMVDRLAGMLNYFLKYLTGSERRRLVVKEPEKYNFKPRDVLLSIIQVWVQAASR